MIPNFQTVVVPVPAGLVGAWVPLPGKWVTVLTATAANVFLGFDKNQPQLIFPGIGYPGPKTGFRSVRLLCVAGATVTITIADEPLAGQNGPLLTAMAASLADIAQEISGGGAPTQLADLLLPASPAAGSQIFAVNAAETEIEITAPRSNAGTVYLGITAARCTDVDKFCTLGPGGIWYSNRAKHAVFGSGSDAFQVVNGKVI